MKDVSITLITTLEL